MEDKKKVGLISAIATILIGGGMGAIIIAVSGPVIWITLGLGIGLTAGGCALKYFQKDIEDKYGTIIQKIEVVGGEAIETILEKLIEEMIERSKDVELKSPGR